MLDHYIASNGTDKVFLDKAVVRQIQKGCRELIGEMSRRFLAEPMDTAAGFDLENLRVFASRNPAPNDKEGLTSKTLTSKFLIISLNASRELANSITTAPTTFEMSDRLAYSMAWLEKARMLAGEPQASAEERQLLERFQTTLTTIYEASERAIAGTSGIQPPARPKDALQR